MPDGDYSRDEYDALVKAYRQIEKSLREIVVIQGREGLLTDWVILSAVQSFDPDGVPVTNTGWHTNPESSMPYHRLLGLVEYAGVIVRTECI